METHDPVNHPSHYTKGGIETIDYIEAKELDFHSANAVKYLSRSGEKQPGVELLKRILNESDVFRSEDKRYISVDDLNRVITKYDREKEIEDLEKAAWYINRKASNLKKLL